MYKKKQKQQKKPAKLVSIICTARNGQFISMFYGIIIFFLPYVHLFKNCWQWFLSIYERLESIITVSHKVHFFFLIFYFVWRCCIHSTRHIRFTMLILPFFIIKHMKSRTELVSPYSGGSFRQRGSRYAAQKCTVPFPRAPELPHPLLLSHHILTCFLHPPCFG